MPVDTELFFERAREIQLRLSGKVIRRDCLPERIEYIAGVDVAYTKEYSIGAVAVLGYGDMSLIERRTSQQVTRVPYRSTFLSFRELPPTVSAAKRLETKPDVFLVDGHGLAHPRRLGFASHLGLALDAPTIGVAKSILCGEVRNNRSEQWKPVVDEGEIVGCAIYSKPSVKPVYVSIGHKVTLQTAIGIVLHCMRDHRIPEPLRQAHFAARSVVGKIAGGEP